MKKSSFQRNGASLFPFEFRISKLSFSDTELKAESENVNIKVLERQLDLSKGVKQARLKNPDQSGTSNTTFS